MKMTTEEFIRARRAFRITGIVEGSRWQHYKGGKYVVDGYGINTETGELMVRYHRIGGPDFNAESEDGLQFLRSPKEWHDVIHPRVKRFLRIP